MKAEQLVQILIEAGKIIDTNFRELSDVVGYAPSEIARWHKTSNPSLRQYVDWAEALGYTVTLIRGTEYQPSRHSRHRS